MITKLIEEKNNASHALSSLFSYLEEPGAAVSMDPFHVRRQRQCGHAFERAELTRYGGCRRQVVGASPAKPEETGAVKIRFALASKLTVDDTRQPFTSNGIRYRRCVG